MNLWLFYVAFCVIWSYFAVTAFPVRLRMTEFLLVTFMGGAVMMFILPIMPLAIAIGYILDKATKDNG